jgi:hypothetical protein
MYSEQQLERVIGRLIYVRKDEYDGICPEIRLLYEDYHKIHDKVKIKLKEELKLIALDEDNLVQSYIKERFVNYDGVEFDMNIVKTNFYYEKALDLYIKLCRIAYSNMEKLVKENNILESDE